MPASEICQFPIFQYSHLLPLRLFNLPSSHFRIPSLAVCYQHNERLFSVLFVLPYKFYPHMVFVHFCPILCFRTNDFPPITPYTADTSWISTGVCSPGKYPCSPVLLPCLFSKYERSDAPPRINHPTGSRLQLPYL